MQYAPTRLSRNEREELTGYLDEQTAQGARSAEINRRVVRDRAGRVHDMGGDFRAVVVGPDNVPIVINEQHAKILDCGHAVTSLPEVLGKCDRGHIICNRHKLYRCAECRSVICSEELEWKNSKPICSRCHSSGETAGIVIVAVIFIIGLIILIVRVSSGA